MADELADTIKQNAQGPSKVRPTGCWCFSIPCRARLIPSGSLPARIA